MANRRMITSSIWQDEWFGPLSFFEQALWIGLFSVCADDQGRLIDSPILIRASVFPYKDVSLDEIETALGTFSQAGRVIRYQSGSKRLLQIVNWWKQQRAQWASRSDWPAPDDWVDRVRTRTSAGMVTENWWQGKVVPGVQAQVAAVVAAQACPTSLSDKPKQEQEQEYKHEQKQKHSVSDSAGLAAAHTAWQNARGGAVNAMDAEQVTAMCDEYGADWVEAAIHDANAARQDKLPSLNYVAAFLKRWKREGFRAPFDAQPSRPRENEPRGSRCRRCQSRGRPE